MECANRECQQLGFTDVASTDLLGQCTEGITVRRLFIRTLSFLPELMDVSHRLFSRARQDK